MFMSIFGTSGVDACKQAPSTAPARSTVARRCWLAFGALLGAVSLASAQPVPEILHYKFNETGTSVTNNASAPPLARRPERSTVASRKTPRWAPRH
jgi:hypothetical protein